MPRDMSNGAVLAEIGSPLFRWWAAIHCPDGGGTRRPSFAEVG